MARNDTDDVYALLNKKIKDLSEGVPPIDYERVGEKLESIVTEMDLKDVKVMEEIPTSDDAGSLFIVEVDSEDYIPDDEDYPTTGETKQLIRDEVSSVKSELDGQISNIENNFKNIGFSVFETANVMDRGGYGITEYNKNSHTVVINCKQLSTDSPLLMNDKKTKMWCFGVTAFDITNLFGKGVTINIDISMTNYSGNDSDSVYIDRWYIGPKGNAWSNAYHGMNMLSGGTKHIEINLDEIIWKVEPDWSKTVYLGLGYDKQITPIDGIYTTPPDNVISAKIYYTTHDVKIIATDLKGFNKADYYDKNEIDAKFVLSGNYITCWGDSLTAGGGWTTKLAELAKMPVYNGGTGGENSKVIVARQGADAIVVNDITIPSDKTPITIADRKNNNGLDTVEGNKVMPLLQGGAHVNPCKIGDILGNLNWTGSSYSDVNGAWTFTRLADGEEVYIDRPTVLRTNFDMNRNNPYLMIIFMGQNGGFTDNADLIRQHRLMIEHSMAKHYLILGLSSGTASQRADYENAMKKEFGRYFISLREYLAHPIYQNDEIVSCYGLADQNLEPDPDYTYNGKTTLQEIAEGTVPHQILADGVHYTAGTKNVIGNMLYKKCCELNIF